MGGMSAHPVPPLVQKQQKGKRPNVHLLSVVPATSLTL